MREGWIHHSQTGFAEAVAVLGGRLPTDEGHAGTAGAEHLGTHVSMSVFSLLGMAALGGGVAAGASALIVAAVAWLVVIAFANAIRLLGELLENLDDRGGP